MDNGMMELGMTLGTLAGRSHMGHRRLGGFHFGPLAIDQQGSQDQAEPDDQRNKHRAE
jgi:hypothetical protein